MAITSLLLWICCSIVVLAGPVQNEKIYHYLSPGKQTQEGVARDIRKLGKKIKRHPGNAELYVQRGFKYSLLRQHEPAIRDFNKAIALNKKPGTAFFGRGMALARAGRINAGIKDLTVYINHHPRSSLAYTKRGVRYIWKGRLDNAERDLKQAVALDAGNAEAHDDLGVVYAQRKKITLAKYYFESAIRSDRSYQKAYHNLAMVHYINGQNQQALKTVDYALKLKPESRNTLLLKATILTAMGQHAEAKKAKDDADFLPEGNWSERSPVH